MFCSSGTVLHHDLGSWLQVSLTVQAQFGSQTSLCAIHHGQGFFAGYFRSPFTVSFQQCSIPAHSPTINST